MTAGSEAGPLGWREQATRVYAGYLLAQAALGILLWVLLGESAVVRSWFELAPERHQVTDAFVFADLALVVIGSAVAARALWVDASWAAAAVSFTAGAILYPTCYLVIWVAMTGVGAIALGLMVTVSTLTLWIMVQTVASSRRR